MELGPIFLISRNKKILLITIVVLFVIFGLIITNGRGDLVSPSIAVGGTSIELPFTDDNTGETLIIHSNKETYGGWDNATVYFSIKNTTRNEQLISSKFLFSTQNESLEKVEVFNDGLWQELNFKEVEISVPDSISTKPIPDEFSGDKQFSQLIRGKETKYFRATLSFPPKSGIKKFYLESFGDGGAYGLLDP